MTDYGYEEEEFSSSFDGRTILRLLKNLRPHWRWVGGFVLMAIIVSTADSILTYIGAQIIDRGVVERSLSAMGEAIVIFLVVLLIQSAAVFAFIFLTGMVGDRVKMDLRRQMFDHLQKLSLSYFSKTPIGWLMARMTSDVDRITELVSWGILDVVWGTTSIITALFFMFRINPLLGGLIFLMVPVLFFTAMYFQRRIIEQYRVARKTNSKITGSYNENITGVRVVKALGREEANLQEFGVLTDRYYGASFRAAWLSAMFLPSVQIISAVALGIIVFFGGLQVDAGTLSIGSIQAFIGYITFMMWPIQDLARVFATMQHAVASAERVFSLLDAKAEIVDAPDARDPGTIRGDIVFENVDFWYDNEKPVLSDFNLRVKAGETIALVGPTGAGKSTVVNLVCRFYEPTGGRITINGQDTREWTQHSIQSRIGMVLQTPHLFSGTVRENLRYGRLDATDGEIEAAAKLAGAHDFIITLDKGYDQDVGEGGNLLSVGQKQLISLARAVLANPEIFIMDEATSSVDTLTEALIQRGMETLMQGRTSFIIAHRLSTIRRANRILVIENGGISEQGTHAELLRQRGHYYRLYTQQFRREREAALRAEAGYTGRYEDGDQAEAETVPANMVAVPMG